MVWAPSMIGSEVKATLIMLGFEEDAVVVEAGEVGKGV